MIAAMFQDRGHVFREIAAMFSSNHTPHPRSSPDRRGTFCHQAGLDSTQGASSWTQSFA